MRRLTSLLAAIVLFSSLLFGATANAASGNQFEAGRIIDDGTFTNTGTMSINDIQNFLNNQVGTCDTNGSQIYSGSETRAQYSESKGYSPPFVCVNQYNSNELSEPSDGMCNGMNAANNVSAAQIIYDVSQSCGINPQVLLVLLQKEQGLVTDDWPWPIEYQEATGFDCPDTSGCNPSYAGFFNQLYFAARQFRVYQANPGTFSFAGGRTSAVQYNPNAACGSSDIFMQTNSTADLYNYTPYQPNAAALNNLYGTGDGCSSYGNRNFWVFFNDWFGSSTSDSNSNILSFINLNYYAGNVQDLGYSSISNYSFVSRNNLSAYPSVPADGNVIPLYDPSGNLNFVRLNYYTGNVQVVTYSAASGFTQLIANDVTHYPSVAADGNVIPMFDRYGNLSFIRLNYPGNVQVVTYSAASGYTQLIANDVTHYPSVAAGSGVLPLYDLSNNLSFVRLNYPGNAQIVTYSAASGYTQLIANDVTHYPSVPEDGNVIPLYDPSGNLSFIRLNYPGNIQAVTYSAASGFTQLTDVNVTAYPAVTANGGIIPLYTR
jgi:hypothetical protein